MFQREGVPHSVLRYLDEERGKMERFVGKLRPQIFLSIVLLGIIAIVGMSLGMTEVTVGCVAGIIALSKDVLQSDS